VSAAKTLDHGAAARREFDAIELLMQNHREVESLFREFEYLQSKDEDAARVVESACAELRMHDALETDVFCRAVRAAAGEADIHGMLARVEDGQQTIRSMILRVEETDSDSEQRDVHFSVLAEHVERHFKDAETRVFPRVQKLDRLDLLSVAAQMKTRRSEMTPEI
jgi:hypothetical protein